ncbi:MAG: Gfo/Idh/MocA family oxidoreductase [Bacteroidaceae bacterium]|nr:Gfo/Idh/MocA family oxidoreductase [Bacteroidaceae bacterium]
MSNRREFLSSAACLMGAVAMSPAANAMNRLPEPAKRRHKSADDNSMVGFVAPRLQKIRVGVVGVGGRGTSAVYRLASVPGVEVTALCELVESKAVNAQQQLKERGFAAPQLFIGPEAYKRMCESGLCDAVHINTNWVSHAEIALFAIRSGLHTFVEVPGCRTIDESWEIVEATEKHRVHCMILSNCCYGEDEMLMINLSRLRILGELYHAEGCYLHETRERQGQAFLGPDKIFSSLETLIDHTGMCYPTHALGPVALAMDINRGDRFDYLVSMGSKGFAWQEYAIQKYGPDAPVSKIKFEANDFNTTLIRTANGKTIMLRQCNNSPMPYTRVHSLYGFNGTVSTNPLTAGVEPSLGAGVGRWLKDEALNEFRAKYGHQLWREAGEIARRVGGHGGMDYLMDLRWSYCLRHGLPLDMTVYDLATWSCVFPLSEQSVRKHSVPLDIPDFTRGSWKTNPRVGDMTIDMEKAFGNKG